MRTVAQSPGILPAVHTGGEAAAGASFGKHLLLTLFFLTIVLDFRRIEGDENPFVVVMGVANVLLGRVSLAPGASVPFDPADPSAILLYAASGELTFSVDVPMTVARAGSGGTPTPPEEVAANTEFTLADGDSAIFPGSMSGEMRNNGAEDATAWVVDIIHFTDAASTPTP